MYLYAGIFQPLWTDRQAVSESPRFASVFARFASQSLGFAS